MVPVLHGRYRKPETGRFLLRRVKTAICHEGLFFSSFSALVDMLFVAAGILYGKTEV